LWRGLPYRNEVLALAILLAVVLIVGDSLPLGIASLGAVNGFSLLLHVIAVILVYRTSRFINFAQIQIGMVGAALFTSLVQGGIFFRLADAVCGSCVGPFPSRGLVIANFVVAASLALVVSVVVALTVYFLVVLRFARHSRLVLTIAMIFVAQVLMYFQHQFGQWLVTDDQRNVEGINPYAASPPPWQVTIDLHPIQLHLYSFATVAAGVVFVVGVATYLRFARSGIALRAASDNPARAQTLGISTVGVTARVWVLVGLLSGSAGLLDAFSQGSAGGAAEDIVLPVRTLVVILAIAVVARFSSLTMAAIAAVAFGILQEAAIWSFDTTAPIDAALVFVIGGLLLLQRYQGDRRSDDESDWQQPISEVRPIPRQLKDIPVVRAWSRTGGALLAVAVLGLPWLLSPSQTNIASIHVAFVIVGVSLLVLTGWAGQVSLGQFAFAAIGAWVAVISGLPLLAAIPLAGLLGALAALIVGLPALKLGGLNLAVTTLAFALSATTIFVSADYLGRNLPTTTGTAEIFGIDLSDQRNMYYFVVVLAGLAVTAVVGLRSSRTGRALIAARDNEATTQSYGINLTRARLVGFAFSGFLAAAAGSVLAYLFGAVTPAVFSPQMSLTLFAFVVIGGLAGLAGPVIGMTYLAVLTMLSGNEIVYALGAGLIGLLVIAALPGGLAQGLYDIRDAMLRRVALRYRIAVPSLFADRDPLAAADRAPLEERKNRDRFVPQRFEPDRQWALRRYGNDDSTKERTGV
jgi:branched-chain amino acid transport system permease protein